MTLLAIQSFVITHPEWGIYLGHCMGLGFWSKLDPIGHTAAVTFPSIAVAEEYMASWNDGRPAEVSVHPVIADQVEAASVAACVAAGLEGWIDDLTPVTNDLPI